MNFRKKLVIIGGGFVGLRIARNLSRPGHRTLFVYRDKGSMATIGRNRAMVLINWIWNYWTFSGGYKLLLRPDRYPVRTYWER